MSLQKVIRCLKTIQNFNTKQHLLQNDQYADITLLHSHDEIACNHALDNYYEKKEQTNQYKCTNYNNARDMPKKKMEINHVVRK